MGKPKLLFESQHQFWHQIIKYTQASRQTMKWGKEIGASYL